MSDKDMLDVTLSEIRGPFDSLWANICGPNGREVFEELKRFNRREPCWVKRQPKPAKPKKVLSVLLERGEPIILPAIGRFIVMEKFRPGETVDGIRVSHLNDNFKRYLLPKVEGDRAAEALVVNNLRKDSRDSVIIPALGGAEKVEVSLGQYWEFLKTADQNLGYAAYIRDIDGTLWAVHAFWHDDGLHVGADSLDDSGGWGASTHFLSR